MKMKIIFLGGTDEVGANSSYIYCDGTGIIIDAGLHPERRDEAALPAFQKLSGMPVDYVVVTHAHTDHTGALPYLVKLFPHIKIFSSLPTADLISIMLKDTAKILKSEIKDSINPELLGLYKKETLRHIHEIITPLDFDKSYTFRGISGRSDINITMRHAGHILGAASVELYGGGQRLLHSGDINISPQTVCGPASPGPGPYDILISETTNFAEESMPERKEEIQQISEFINQVSNENGSVLLPVFALGKAQEVRAIVARLMNDNKIPRLPVYYGGLAVKVENIYKTYKYNYNLTHNIKLLEDNQYIALDREAIQKQTFLNQPAIVISTGGMLGSGTLAHKLFRQWAGRTNFGIIQIGYQSPGTLGYALSSGLPEFEHNGLKYSRSCRHLHVRLSAHAGPDQLIELAARLNPRKVFLVHGDGQAADNMRFRLWQEYKNDRTILPEPGREYEV